MAEDLSQYTAEQLREKAARSDRQQQESWERSDTDGFLSQWASGLTAQLYREQADLIEAGGRAEFPALFDTDGNLIAAKRFDSQYGFGWGLLESDKPYSRFTRRVYLSRASTAERRRAADAKKGYQIGRVRARCEAKVMGSGKGLSGTAWVGLERTDGGFSRDVEIVSTSYYPE